MTKTCIRFFTIADYEEEEIWLREQSRQGMHLLKMIPPCFYTFEISEPEDVIYRLDFKNQVPDSDYKTLFQDFGWEYAGSCVGWHYFRKPAEAAEQEDDGEIFSDNESRLAMVQKIIMQRMLPLLVIFLCAVIPNLTPNLTRAKEGPWGAFFTIFFSVMTVLYIYLMVHCTVKLAALKSKYEK